MKILLIWKQADGWHSQLYQDGVPTANEETGERTFSPRLPSPSPQACAIAVWKQMRPADSTSLTEIRQLPYAIVPATSWQEADEMAAGAMQSGILADLVPAHLQYIHGSTQWVASTPEPNWASPHTTAMRQQREALIRLPLLRKTDF